MDDSASRSHTAHLDKEEREHLEDVVTEMRDRVEANVRYQLEDEYELDEKPDDDASVSEEQEALVEAIDLEAVDGDWEDGYEQYITGVGYTVVNRLAALRCLEVRDFLDEEVTRFRDDGLTPAADRLVTEEFMLEEEAVREAYRNACDDLAAEIEVLFDRSTAYSRIDPDDDTFEDLCGMLDEVPDEVWRADDVLGWVYEYYNRPVVEALDAKNTLEPADVGPANQFYTPHWVVRMLTDNSLGKLYLEATGRESEVPQPEALSPEERKERLVTPEDSPTVEELCTYLIPDEAAGDAPEFDHPSELRVIDPACGSGHFLLYAFDVLERIWWEEEDELDRAEIPAKILKHNLYGVDIDLRSCQLSAFNLYLKARTRAEAEGGTFEMPNVDVVCADARVAEVEEGTEVLDEITGEGTDLREALGEIIDTFQHTEALGSLLDVSGTLEDAFESGQADLSDWGDGTHRSLNSFLKALRASVDRRSSDSFGEQNLRSFLNLLVVLTREYDVSLMNPPYGSRGRMPKEVREYASDHYEYLQEYYINFFEVCDRLVVADGRIGMLVPWSFLFNQTFESFRSDFVGQRGSFDFLSEFGYGILDNATVGTVGTVVRSGGRPGTTGTFIRLHDSEKGRKEATYLRAAFGDTSDDVDRYFEVALDEFDRIPGTPICYSLPSEIRDLHATDLKIDPDVPGVSGDGIGDVKQGLATADNDRFLRKHWEVTGDAFRPFTNAGGDVWVLPEVDEVINWAGDGARVDRAPNSVLRNMDYQTRDGLTWAYIKRTGRRFGYYPSGGPFGHASNMLFTDTVDPWLLLGALNSDVFHGLMLCLTPERKWESGYIGMLPWFRELESHDELRTNAREQYTRFVKRNVHNIGSPYYIGPELLPESAVSGFFHAHPHTAELPADPDRLFETGDADRPLVESARRAEERRRRNRRRIEALAERTDEAVSEALDIGDHALETVRQEIFLRTVETPEDRAVPAPDAVTETPADFERMVKDLLHHLVLRTVDASDDGIVPLSDAGSDPGLLARLEGEFERVWDEDATARLAEVDEVLGNRSASDEAYPNLRSWLEDDLFEYHVSALDRTPILWRLSTERLVSDADGEGFGCLVDYHRVDASTFDRLQNRYLDPRRTRVRERLAAANSRRNDGSLSAAERADAAAAYDRCESALEQLAAFEDQLGMLSEPTPRDWPDANRDRAAEAADRVAAFRERTAARLDTLHTLAEVEGVEMEDLFSPSFYGTVRNNEAEWLGALDDLQAAFEAYAEDGSVPVAAHLYDRFGYYDELAGSAHYASNGILFMTYYFEGFEDVDQARIGDSGVSDRQRLLADLAADVDAYTQLAADIAADCEAVAADVPDEWDARARSEVTTAGYQPVHEHGVAINITPLAAANIVPAVVEDEVL